MAAPEPPGAEEHVSEYNQDSRLGACPSDSELASFVDGDLTPEARSHIVSHLAACDDCREIVAMASVEAIQRERRTAPWYRRGRFLLAIAAGLAAALAVVLIPRGPAPTTADTTAWSDLASAMDAERTVEARLSALDDYRPLVSPTRSGAASTAPSNFRLEAVAARLREEAVRHPAIANLHAAGVAELALGRTDDALKTLSQAAAQEHAGAGVYADLAAVHIARARQAATAGAAITDWLSAVGAAERACALDPRLPAGWFNRALALEGLGRQAEAQQAWGDFTTRFTAGDGWRGEALDRLTTGAR